ncbi:DgyrCDS14285 [Dimorphilus gyrociliatus]|uniref:Staphylococcal nuclease domain-containing protein 1 n=1 Tax=Dimorphilus gyrociliatus TaxID=2664684 RepID=A0A7I8WD57_9ANNE|nr:DgyrCDS14285 [Dimorphilus gyrociliatus]
MTSTTNPTLHKGIVKQIVSGDCIVIRGQPRGGPPPERTICLSNIEAPRLARRPNPANTSEVKDSPCAWEAREFLRKKLIGKEVCFSIEYKLPTTGREYGFVWLGKDNTGENVAESLVELGFAGVRKGNAKNDSEAQTRLVALEESAKAAQRGKWANDADKTIRDISWNIEKDRMRNFVDSRRSKPIKAVIEHVRDGCTVRAFLLPNFEYITIMLTGIKTPMFKQEGDKQVPEEFAEEAKYFVECRLLQRDVEIILEGLSGMNFLGTVLHPNGNISELLLKEGFAKCIDWSMGCVTQEIEKMRKAEKSAKERHVRLWKDYKPPSNSHTSPVQDGSSRSFSAKVTEIANADALVVKMDNGTDRKIFLASIRPPRLPNDSDKASPDKKKIKPLYDIPHMFEAREFLRKKLVGKRVKVSIDYIQPASNQFPEKTCCTVHIADINVAEALVSKGYATVVRYRQDDNQRAVCYDQLLTAENRAEKKNVGVHSKKEYVPVRVQDLSGNVNASRQFYPSLQRAGKTDALVEFVASGSRLRVYMPRNTCIATILLAGIECPKASRQNVPAEPFGEEALALIKEKVLQHDVQVAVESMDKGGNFIGYVYTLDGLNLSEYLVKNGLAKLHFSAERGPHYGALSSAQSAAQREKLNIWQDYEAEAESHPEIDIDPSDEKPEETGKDTKEYENVIVTEVSDDFFFFAQDSGKGPALDKLMNELRTDLASNPPVPGAFQPKKGDLCVAKFSEDQTWYRAKILSIDAQKQAEILFIDFGNSERQEISKLAPLAAAYRDLPAVAKKYTLACVTLPSEDEDTRYDACDELRRLINGCECRLSVEYHVSTDLDAVQLLHSQEDIGQQLVANGFVVVDKTKRRDRKVRELFTKYTADQEKAKTKRLNIWMYGDITADDATEFGYNR